VSDVANVSVVAQEVEVFEMGKRRSMRRAREQAGSVESIPDGEGKCKDLGA
jgi:hypothetical protein